MSQDVAPRVREAMRANPGFEEIGARMLFAWNEGLSGLCERHTDSVSHIGLGDALASLPGLPPAQPQRTVMGRSEMLASELWIG
ncbi:serine/threonine-protein kinase HipA [Dokdonella immobilis]|uniref:Serine/threonine-protein kinase HipA n=1 Tax=Dokdonella immobilis TaxID=578942 RepID=A0A1I4X7T7_9GAMM|nr:serine/threonine-protein kinase HipA [Dokdonella immobilis]